MQQQQSEYDNAVSVSDHAPFCVDGKVANSGPEVSSPGSTGDTVPSPETVPISAVPSVTKDACSKPKRTKKILVSVKKPKGTKGKAKATQQAAVSAQQPARPPREGERSCHDTYGSSNNSSSNAKPTARNCTADRLGQQQQSKTQANSGPTNPDFGGFLQMFSELTSMIHDPSKMQRRMEAIPKDELNKMSNKEVVNRVTQGMFGAPESPIAKMFNTIIDKSQSIVTPDGGGDNGSSTAKTATATPPSTPPNTASFTNPGSSSSSSQFPSVFEKPPEKPADSDRKYAPSNGGQSSGSSSTLSPESVEKRKSLYAMFNSQLEGLLTQLALKLPHKRSLYESLQRIFRCFAERSPAAPCEKWVKSVKGHESKLLTYSEANVKYICENLPKMELLNMLELDNEWHRFDTVELENFHGQLRNMQLVADTLTEMPGTMLDTIGSLQQTFGDGIRERIREGQSIAQVGLYLSEHVCDIPEVMESFKQVTTEVSNAMQSSLPTPPSVQTFLSRVSSISQSQV